MCRFLFLQLHVTKVSVVPVWEGLLADARSSRCSVSLGFSGLCISLCVLGSDAMQVHEVR